VGQLFDSDRRAEESALGASSGTLPPESESGSNETFAKIRFFFCKYSAIKKTSTQAQERIEKRIHCPTIVTVRQVVLALTWVGGARICADAIASRFSCCLSSQLPSRLLLLAGGVGFYKLTSRQWHTSGDRL
jgi:hypothetical protein